MKTLFHTAVMMTGLLAAGNALAAQPVKERLAPADPHPKKTTARPAAPVRTMPAPRPAPAPVRVAKPAPVVRPMPVAPKPVAIAAKPLAGPVKANFGPTPPRMPSTPNRTVVVTNTGNNVTRLPPNNGNNGPLGPPPRTRFVPPTLRALLAAGGFGATDSGAAGRVLITDQNGRPTSQFGRFVLTSDFNIEITLAGGFLVRISIDDFDPATGTLTGAFHTIDTLGQPNNQQLAGNWRYINSGRIRIPIGAAPFSLQMQQQYESFGPGGAGGRTSINALNQPYNLIFVP